MYRRIRVLCNATDAKNAFRSTALLGLSRDMQTEDDGLRDDCWFKVHSTGHVSYFGINIVGKAGSTYIDENQMHQMHSSKKCAYSWLGRISIFINYLNVRQCWVTRLNSENLEVPLDNLSNLFPSLSVRFVGADIICIFSTMEVCQVTYCVAFL